MTRIPGTASNGNGAVIDIEAQALAQTERDALLEPFDPGIAWDHGGKEICEYEILNASVDAAVSMYRIGSALIWARENIEHGQWYAWLSEQGIERTWANYCVRVAAQFGGGRIEKVRGLGRNKMRQLLALPAGDLEDLLDNGAVETLKLDEVEKMTVAQLRAKVRDLTKKADREKEKREQAEHVADDLRERIAKRDQPRSLDGIDLELGKSATYALDILRAFNADVQRTKNREDAAHFAGLLYGWLLKIVEENELNRAIYASSANAVRSNHHSEIQRVIDRTGVMVGDNNEEFE